MNHVLFSFWYAIEKNYSVRRVVTRSCLEGNTKLQNSRKLVKVRH